MVMMTALVSVLVKLILSCQVRGHRIPYNALNDHMVSTPIRVCIRTIVLLKWFILITVSYRGWGSCPIHNNDSVQNIGE